MLHKVSERISIQKGVRQGDTTTPKLFMTLLMEVLRNGKRQESWYMDNTDVMSDLLMILFS